MNFCESCGKPLGAGDQFCQFCGATIPGREQNVLRSRPSRINFLSAFKNLFSGRMSKKSWLSGFIFIVVVSFVLISALFLLNAYAAMLISNEVATKVLLTVAIAIISVIAAFAFILSVSIHIRRFHDIGNSGLWLLLAIIPYAGLLVFLYLLIKKGQPGPNKYGEVPTQQVGTLPVILNIHKKS